MLADPLIDAERKKDEDFLVWNILLFVKLKKKKLE